MTTEQIIRNEIKRLEQAYRNKQDLYAYTGSRSTDNTMYKYSVLKDALEKSLAGPSDEEERLNRQINWMRECMANATAELHRLEKERELLPGYADRIVRLMEGKDRR